jgi:hypothetical protein
MFTQRLIYRAGCLLALLAGLLVLAACDSDATPTPALKPEEVLAQSAEKMAALKSFQFGLETSKLEKPPNNLYITAATGKVEQPGKLEATATALLLGSPVEVQVVALGDDQYMTDPLSKRWQKIPASFNALALLDPGKAIGDILTGVQSPTDAGSETLDGVASYRVQGTVAPDAVRSLSPEITAADPLQVTVWIGSSDFLARQAQITGALMTGEPSSVVRTLKFSHFDEPMNIQLPPGVTP